MKKILALVLALAMTCFIVFGLPKVDYSTLFTVDFAPAAPWASSPALCC